MDFFTNAIDVLQTLVIALGGGLCVWGGINLLEGYGQKPGHQAAHGRRGCRPHRRDPDPAAVRPAGLMAPHNTRGRSRYTGPPAKEVIPVDL